MRSSILTPLVALAIALSPLVSAAAVADKREATSQYRTPKPYADEWELQGCYKDFYPAKRAMQGDYTEAHPGKPGMTIATCLKYCGSKGQKFAGLEAGFQCFCSPGNLLFGSKRTQSPNTIAGSNNGGCKTKCAGNKDQNCGGDSHLLLFASNTIPVGLPVTDSAKFEYVGCYRDDTNNRLFSKYEGASSTNTAASCAKKAAKSWTKADHLFGLEYRNECWSSGAGLVKSEKFKAAKASETHCQRTCTGEAGEICGGSGYVSVYRTKTDDAGSGSDDSGSGSDDSGSGSDDSGSGSDDSGSGSDSASGSGSDSASGSGSESASGSGSGSA